MKMNKPIDLIVLFYISMSVISFLSVISTALVRNNPIQNSSSSYSESTTICSTSETTKKELEPIGFVNKELGILEQTEKLKVLERDQANTTRRRSIAYIRKPSFTLVDTIISTN